MIKISIIKENSCYSELEVSGHSLLGDYGNNIVCAGISSVTIAILNGLTEIAYIKNLNIDCTSGYIKLDIGNTLTTSEQSKLNLLLDTLILSYKQFEQEYPEEIKLEIREC